MKAWICTLKYYLRQFLELGVLLLGVSVFAELLFGPDVAFFGSRVTNKLVELLDSIGDQGVAALILIFVVTIILICAIMISKFNKVTFWPFLTKILTLEQLKRRENAFLAQISTFERKRKRSKMRIFQKFKTL